MVTLIPGRNPGSRAITRSTSEGITVGKQTGDRSLVSMTSGVVIQSQSGCEIVKTMGSLVHKNLCWGNRRGQVAD